MASLSRAFLFTLLFILFNQAAFAQQWLWAKGSAGEHWAKGNGIAVDAKGNSYVIGSFGETAKFGATKLISEEDSRFNRAFLAKYDPMGRVIWAKKVGGAEYQEGLSIAIDGKGNIFVTGSASKASSFPGTYIQIVFVSKFNQSGIQLWTQISGGGGFGTDIKPDANGNCYVTGRFGGTVTFGDITLTGRKSRNSFVVKYDPSGKVLWARGIDDTPVFSDINNGIDFDGEGNVYVTGSFQDTTTIGHITLKGNSLMGNSFEDIFIAKYDVNGNVLWAKQAGGTGFDSSYGIAVDAKGNSYITGSYNPNSAIEGYNTGAFMAKYNTNGELIWSKNATDSKITDLNNNSGIDLAFDAMGNIYLLGTFSGSATFGSTTLVGEQKNNLFVAKYNPAGEALWAKQGGLRGYDVALDAKGNGYVTGSFEYPISFDDSKLALDGKPRDMFIAKFGSTDLPLEVEIVFIPNIITPNGDGLNDTFVPFIPSKIIDLKVYNRWGKLVYEQADYQHSWDGNNLSSGTYYYLLTSDSGMAWKGWVEISK